MARSGYWGGCAAGSRRPGIRGRYKGPILGSVLSLPGGFLSRPSAWAQLFVDAARSGQDGSRLVGFDNAHPVRESRGPGGKSQGPFDHRHRLETVRPYRFRDAPTLLEDFWTEVDKLLKEKGVIS